MRRTYRSKKDTGGALDHRDVILNMDERSSAFDAFYIQNIKQTKRELSCIASSNHIVAASNKVRKRKYVKRLVKEIEPVRQRETMSSSAYLTPDKSIRVNKALDPFDMLFNSSPSNQDAPKAVKDDAFEKLLPKTVSKSYARKRIQKKKKYNYSSTESDFTESDKENTSDSRSNITDIRTHELIIEKEPSSCPKYLNESINKIVSNLSLINNFKRKGSNGSFNTSYKCGRNKLLKDVQSPILQKSPLCSTPFKEKYRGVSIFKFSPISQKDQEISPNCVTILEEKDDINTSVTKNVIPKISHKYRASPLTHLPSVSVKFKSDILVNKTEDNSYASISMLHNGSAQSIIEDVVIEKVDEKENNTSMHENIVQCEITLNDNKIQNDNNSTIGIEQSSFQITEAEPFLGFSNSLTEDITANKICLLKKLQENDSDDLMEDVEEELVTNQINLNNSDDISNHSYASNKCNTSQSSSDNQNSDDESLYDTCNSEQSSLVDDNKGSKELIVAIERMNDSVFMKYYEKLEIEYDESEISEQTDNDDFMSLANNSNEEMINNSLSTESDCVETKPNPIVITDSSTTDDVMSSYDEDESNDEEEKCISFVTTRRKNEIINDSMFIFNHSYGSSSTDCDKTVLSNIKVENFDVDAVDNSSEHNSDNLETNEEDNKVQMTDSSPEKIIPKITIRKSSKLPRQSNIMSPANLIHNSKMISSTSCERLRTSRRSSRLQRQSSLGNIDCETELANSTSNKRFSRILSRKSSRLPSQIHSSSPELNTSKNEVTLIDTNEVNNKTVIETYASEIDSNNTDATSPLTTKNTSWMSKEGTKITHPERSSYAGAEVKPSIVLQPGKKWERSLSIYRRMTMAADHFDQSILEEECLQKKGRKYRQSVMSTMEMQDSLHNDSINSRRSTFISKPCRPTIRFVIDPNITRVTLNTNSVFDDLKGFLNEECDDTVIELSKLSIADSEHEVTILDNFHESERLATARDYVLRRCNQTEPILFDECFPETVLKNCHKIGEGVYGEVFLWRGRDGRARVMKIVPIAGTVKVNGEDQKDFHEIISEIVIAMELSALRAPIADFERQLDEGNDIHALDLHTVENATDTFNEVLAVRCVYGPYPSRLLDLWELYDECKGSENDSPAALPTDQHYLVLELANAGQDLESYQFCSAQQAHALFQQIAFGLAVGEEAFQFEHRDLHWGNVLIAPTEQKLATFILRGRAYRVPRCGVAATVIDYSLSRLTLPLAADSAALYNDLATDDQLFDAVGDYQFEVYRLMRDKLGNDWKNFEPYTNILWLHYTVDKMITALRYKRTNTKIHKHYIEKLKGIKNRILEYGSAVQYVLTDIEI